MKIEVQVTPNGYSLRFFHSPKAASRYDQSTELFVGKDEVAFFLSKPVRFYTWFDDGIRQIMLTPSHLLSIYVGQMQWPNDGPLTAADQLVGFKCGLQVRRFFKVLSDLRAKFPPDDSVAVRPTYTMYSEAFNRYEHVVPKLSWWQMIRHPNAHDIGKTLARFAKVCSAERRARLREDLSRYLAAAHVYGTYSCDELYFDGRAGKGTLGYNGAFILREEGYSIHT